jgi:hypothetical protein
MRRDSLSSFYWTLWVVTTMLTGILAGYMVSHSIMLGRFFTWFVDSNNLELLRQTYTAFRAQGRAHIWYDVPLFLHLIVGVVWTALSFLLKRHRLIATTAGLSTVWVSILFFGLRFDEAEDAVLTSTADPATTQYFAVLNVPLHSLFAVIYVTSLFLLLLVPLRANADRLSSPNPAGARVAKG